MELQEVFGIATEVNSASYVDRGNLDTRFLYLLGTERHIAIHGDSKQGKSWLRRNGLPPEKTMTVQCQPDTSPEAILVQALGVLGVRADVRQIGRTTLQGELDFSAMAEGGLPLLAKVKAELGGKASATQETQAETETLGRTPADLAWVAATLRASSQRLVVEDFHYVADASRSNFAYLLKALGDYGVFVIIVGIWPDDNLLIYLNGELDGRIEDLRLRWDPSELESVLRKGCAALAITMTDRLRDALVTDAYGNVGLLQRLAEQVCLAAGIRSTVEATGSEIDVGSSLDAARTQVAGQMRSRFVAFADGFVRGMKRMPPGQGLMVYKHLLRACTEAADEELRDGVDSRLLLNRIQESGGQSIRQSDLTQALDRIGQLQAKMNISPPVLTYDADRRKVFLADRSFLFYRRYGPAHWPWKDDATLDTAIASAPAAEMLTLFDDTDLVESRL